MTEKLDDSGFEGPTASEPDGESEIASVTSRQDSSANDAKESLFVKKLSSQSFSFIQNILYEDSCTGVTVIDLFIALKSIKENLELLSQSNEKISERVNLLSEETETVWKEFIGLLESMRIFLEKMNADVSIYELKKLSTPSATDNSYLRNSNEKMLNSDNKSKCACKECGRDFKETCTDENEKFTCLGCLISAFKGKFLGQLPISSEAFLGSFLASILYCQSGSERERHPIATKSSSLTFDEISGNENLSIIESTMQMITDICDALKVSCDREREKSPPRGTDFLAFGDPPTRRDPGEPEEPEEPGEEPGEELTSSESKEMCSSLKEGIEMRGEITSEGDSEFEEALTTQSKPSVTCMGDLSKAPSGKKSASTLAPVNNATPSWAGKLSHQIRSKVKQRRSKRHRKKDVKFFEHRFDKFERGPSETPGALQLSIAANPSAGVFDVTVVRYKNNRYLAKYPTKCRKKVDPELVFNSPMDSHFPLLLKGSKDEFLSGESIACSESESMKTCYNFDDDDMGEFAEIYVKNEGDGSAERPLAVPGSKTHKYGDIRNIEVKIGKTQFIEMHKFYPVFLMQEYVKKTSKSQQNENPKRENHRNDASQDKIFSLSSGERKEERIVIESSSSDLVIYIQLEIEDDSRSAPNCLLFDFEKGSLENEIKRNDSGTSVSSHEKTVRLGNDVQKGESLFKVWRAHQTNRVSVAKNTERVIFKKEKQGKQEKEEEEEEEEEVELKVEVEVGEEEELEEVEEKVEEYEEVKEEKKVEKNAEEEVVVVKKEKEVEKNEEEAEVVLKEEKEKAEAEEEEEEEKEKAEEEEEEKEKEKAEEGKGKEKAEVEEEEVEQEEEETKEDKEEEEEEEVVEQEEEETKEDKEEEEEEEEKEAVEEKKEEEVIVVVVVKEKGEEEGSEEKTNKTEEDVSVNLMDFKENLSGTSIGREIQDRFLEEVKMIERTNFLVIKNVKRSAPTWYHQVAKSWKLEIVRLRKGEVPKEIIESINLSTEELRKALFLIREIENDVVEAEIDSAISILPRLEVELRRHLHTKIKGLGITETENRMSVDGFFSSFDLEDSVGGESDEGSEYRFNNLLKLLSNLEDAVKTSEHSKKKVDLLHYDSSKIYELLRTLAESIRELEQGLNVTSLSKTLNYASRLQTAVKEYEGAVRKRPADQWAPNAKAKKKRKPGRTPPEEAPVARHLKNVRKKVFQMVEVEAVGMEERIDRDFDMFDRLATENDEALIFLETLLQKTQKRLSEFQSLKTELKDLHSFFENFQKAVTHEREENMETQIERSLDRNFEEILEIGNSQKEQLQERTSEKIFKETPNRVSENNLGSSLDKISEKSVEKNNFSEISEKIRDDLKKNSDKSSDSTLKKTSRSVSECRLDTTTEKVAMKLPNRVSDVAFKNSVEKIAEKNSGRNSSTTSKGTSNRTPERIAEKNSRKKIQAKKVSDKTLQSNQGRSREKIFKKNSKRNMDKSFKTSSETIPTRASEEHQQKTPRKISKKNSESNEKKFMGRTSDENLDRTCETLESHSDKFLENALNQISEDILEKNEERIVEKIVSRGSLDRLSGRSQNTPDTNTILKEKEDEKEEEEKDEREKKEGGGGGEEEVEEKEEEEEEEEAMQKIIQGESISQKSLEQIVSSFINAIDYLKLKSTEEKSNDKNLPSSQSFQMPQELGKSTPGPSAPSDTSEPSEPSDPSDPLSSAIKEFKVLGQNSLYLSWTEPEGPLEGSIQGYEIYVDGKLNQKVRNPRRLQAVLYSVDLSKKIQVKLYAVVEYNIKTLLARMDLNGE